MRRRAVAIVVASAFAACGFPKLERIDAQDTAEPPTGWTTKMVGGVNTPMTEDDPSFTDNRLTLVFVSYRNNVQPDLYLGTRTTPDGDFTVMPLAPLNGSATDEHSPEITADGKTIYFTSDREVGTMHVWRSTNTGGTTWSAPERVTELWGSGEGDVAVSPDQRTAMIVRSGVFLIAHRSTATAMFDAPVPVPSLDVPGGDPAAPSITDNADAVYFHANEPRQLYYARRDGDHYLKPVPMPLPPLSRTARTAAPFVSADEHHLVFSYMNAIYEATR